MRNRAGVDGAGASEILAGVALGVLGGIAGGFVMNQSHNLFDRAKARLGREEPVPEDSLFDNAGPRREETRHTPATVQAADEVSRALLDRPVRPGHRREAGNAAHFLFSAVSGAVYGGLAPVAPAITAGRGIPAGVALWVLADEVAMPAMGWLRGPRHYPPSRHAQAMINHILFGLTVETIRAAGLRALGLPDRTGGRAGGRAGERAGGWAGGRGP